jgi:hypothetical protein
MRESPERGGVQRLSGYLSRQGRPAGRHDEIQPGERLRVPVPVHLSEGVRAAGFGGQYEYEHQCRNFGQCPLLFRRDPERERDREGLRRGVRGVRYGVSHK